MTDLQSTFWLAVEWIHFVQSGKHVQYLSHSPFRTKWKIYAGIDNNAKLFPKFVNIMGLFINAVVDALTATADSSKSLQLPEPWSWQFPDYLPSQLKKYRLVNQKQPSFSNDHTIGLILYSNLKPCLSFLFFFQSRKPDSYMQRCAHVTIHCITATYAALATGHAGRIHSQAKIGGP